MAGLGAPELIIVLAIVLLVFGGAKLPKLARSLGEAQREFKQGSELGVPAEDDVAASPGAAASAATPAAASSPSHAASPATPAVASAS